MNSRIQTQHIEDFIARVRMLRNKRDPNMTLTAREAEQLADSLSQVMTRLVTIQEEIINALKTAQQSATVDIEMDGGEFNKK
jgi:hypothetical protein|tara:strand:- start:358 stop:603 length:246 start_codon:yes stop_codon:yes gene_type:complete